VDDSLAILQRAGAGAAYEPVAGMARMLQGERLLEARPHACVAWWCVTPTPAITALRNAATIGSKNWADR
jgi:hypothetical protein